MNAILDIIVPVFGMGTSALFLGETLPAWKLTAAALVMAGLSLNLLWPSLRLHLAARLASAAARRRPCARRW